MHTNWRFPFHLSWPCQTWRHWGWSVRKWETFSVLGLRLGVIWGVSSKPGIRQQSENRSPQGQLEIISGCKLPHSRGCRVESGAQPHCTPQHLLVKPWQHSCLPTGYREITGKHRCNKKKRRQESINILTQNSQNALTEGTLSTIWMNVFCQSIKVSRTSGIGHWHVR